MRHLNTGTLPSGSSGLRLCSSPTCTNGDLGNGSINHHYSSIGAPSYHSLRRSGRSTRNSSRNHSSPSPPPPPPPRYPGQYPTLPANGNVCHHYNSTRYGADRETAGTMGGRESRLRQEKNNRRLEQLSASSHQQRQEELEIHRGGYHA